MRQENFKVNIIGLSLSAHRFDFKFGDEFFETYGRGLVSNGAFAASVVLDKRETIIEATFHIEGATRLTCDRSLEEFDHPMHIDGTILFKYGAEATELSDEIVLITRDQASLDLGQYLYELIGINVPMKRLHPRFRQDGLEESDIRLVYSSSPEEGNEEAPVDPR